MNEDDKNKPLLNIERSSARAPKSFVLGNMDADKDGKVTKAEMEGFEKTIKNSGLTIPAETQAIIDQTKADIAANVYGKGSVGTSFYSDPTKEALSRRDLDGDGGLSLNEINGQPKDGAAIPNGDVGIIDIAAEKDFLRPETALNKFYEIDAKNKIKLDGNGDGKISIVEVDKFQKFFKDRDIKMIGFDGEALKEQITNVGKNGAAKIEDIAKLDDPRFEEARQKLQEMDTNKDGLLSPNEIAAKQAVQPQVPNR